MDTGKEIEKFDREELWESLRALRPEIEQMAAEEFDGGERQKQLAALIARIVTAELDFRAREQAGSPLN